MKFRAIPRCLSVLHKSFEAREWVVFTPTYPDGRTHAGFILHMNKNKFFFGLWRNCYKGAFFAQLLALVITMSINMKLSIFPTDRMKLYITPFLSFINSANPVSRFSLTKYSLFSRLPNVTIM